MEGVYIPFRRTSVHRVHLLSALTTQFTWEVLISCFRNVLKRHVFLRVCVFGHSRVQRKEAEMWSDHLLGVLGVEVLES